MAQAGKKSLLLLSLLLIAFASRGQIAFNDVAGLRNYGSPTMGNDRYTPYAIIIGNNRPTFYLWDESCPRADDGAAHVKPIPNGRGCWERATNAYLVGGVGIVRDGDTFKVDPAYFNARFTSKDSFNTWQQAVINGYYTKDQSDARYQLKSGMGQYPTTAQVEQRFTDFATFAGSQFYPLSNPAGYIAAESQTLSIAGRNLSISGGNTVIVPVTDTTSLSARINAKQNAGNYLTAEVDGSTTNELQTLSGSGTTITLSNGGGSYNVPVPNVTPAYSTAARALNTAFRPSTTRTTLVSYSLTLTTALSLLNLNSSAVAYLEISADGTTWNTINSAGISRTLAVSLSVGLNETSYYNLQCVVPANFFCRIRTTTAGGGTAAFSSGQETQLF